jgi:hypothetical protein
MLLPLQIEHTNERKQDDWVLLHINYLRRSWKYIVDI